MSIFKKETRSQKIMNGVKDVASTVGAIGLATVYFAGAAVVEAAAEADDSYNRGYSHGFDDGFGTTLSGSSYNNNRYNNYKSNYSGSSYRSVANSTKDITRDFMKEFVRSFGTLETPSIRNMRSGCLHAVSYNSSVYKSYYSNANFRVACSGYDWKLYAGVENDVVMMVLTSRCDGIIDVASCYSSDLYGKFRAEAEANYRVNDIHTAVLKALQ